MSGYKTYIIIEEPIYSQGLGNYIMITHDKENIYKLKKQLYEYKNNIINGLYNGNNDCNDISKWEFLERVYEVSEIYFNDSTGTYEYWGYLLAEKCNCGNYELVFDDYSNKISKSVKIHTSLMEMKKNYVYDNLDGTKSNTIDLFNLFDLFNLYI